MKTHIKAAMPLFVMVMLSACGGGGSSSATPMGAIITSFDDPLAFQSAAAQAVREQPQTRASISGGGNSRITRNGFSGSEVRVHFDRAVYLGIWIDGRVGNIGCNIHADQCGRLTADRLGAAPDTANLPSGLATYNLVGAGGYLRGPSETPELILGILTGSLEADFANNSVSGSLADTLSAGRRLQLDGTITGASINGQANVTPPSQYAGDSVFSGTLPYSGGFAEDGDWVFGESRGTGEKGRRLGFSFVGDRQ